MTTSPADASAPRMALRRNEATVHVTRNREAQ
jgi:hypothetical protein